MAAHVVELSSDSEDANTGKFSIVSNGSTSHADDKKNKSSSEGTKVTTPRVGGPKLRNPVPLARVRRLVDGGDLKKLRVADLQSYARDQCLRISGTKEVLFNRIKKHMEFLEQGVLKYDSKTFMIDCTGDVCVGDVVRFRQRVYNKNIAYQTHPRPVGMRMVVGEVVKESYGEKTQQHTFTIEVLRSRGYKELAPMQRLLIKGRNLYRFRVRRQPWEDENIRLTVLEEKHDRGDAARLARRLRKPLAGMPRASAPLDVDLGGMKKRKRPEVCQKSGSVQFHRRSAAKSKKAKKTTHSPSVALDSAMVKQASLPSQRPWLKLVSKKQVIRKQNLNQSRKGRKKQTSQPSGGTVGTKSNLKLQAERRTERLASNKLETKVMPGKKQQYYLRSTSIKG